MVRSTLRGIRWSANSSSRGGPSLSWSVAVPSLVRPCFQDQWALHLHEKRLWKHRVKRVLRALYRQSISSILQNRTMPIFEWYYIVTVYVFLKSYWGRKSTWLYLLVTVVNLYLRVGKSTIAQALASRFNMPNVLQTDIVNEVKIDPIQRSSIRRNCQNISYYN